MPFSLIILITTWQDRSKSKKTKVYMKHKNVVNIVYIYKHSIFMDGKTNTNAE